MGWASAMRRAEREALREFLRVRCDEIEHLVGQYNCRETPFSVAGDRYAHVLPNPLLGRFFISTSTDHDEVVGYTDDGDEIGRIQKPAAGHYLGINEPANQFFMSTADGPIVFDLCRFPIGTWKRVVTNANPFRLLRSLDVDETTGNVAFQSFDGVLTIVDRKFNLKHRSFDAFSNRYLHGDQCIGPHSASIGGIWANVHIKNWADRRSTTIDSCALVRWDAVFGYDAASRCLLSHSGGRVFVQHIVNDLAPRFWVCLADPSLLRVGRKTNGAFRFYRTHDHGVTITDQEY